MTSKRNKSKKTQLEEGKPKIAVEFLEEGLDAELNEIEQPEIAEKTEKKKQRPEYGLDNVETMKRKIEKVKMKEGVIGYILRNATSASIDLNDPTKVIDYAILSSSALEAAEKLSSSFELGHLKQILVEGDTAKVLCLTVEENRVSVFMEKNVDHKRIYKELLT